MSLPLPKGAYPIHQARLSGKRPSEMVLISTVGPLDEGNPVVVFPAGDDPRQYDWRWSMGLPTALVFVESTKLTARVILEEILKSIASEVYLWRADLQKGWVAMRTSEGIRLFRFMAGETREFRGLGCS
jgi:hypothetical protein